LNHGSSISTTFMVMALLGTTMTLGKLQVAASCDKCGNIAALPEAGGQLRCVECGRFAEENPDYCLEHDVDKTRSPHGRCPYCYERERVRQQEQAMHERRADPDMHPSVDAPRR